MAIAAMTDQLEVLLIEDNPADARLVREMLGEAGPGRITVTHTEKLHEAVALLRHSGFNAILLDLSLPDSQGMNTFLRTHAEAHDAPIVVLTGLVDEEVALEAVAAGAQDYLIKSKVDGQLLYHAIRYAIERRRIDEELRTTQARLHQVLTSNPAVLYATRITAAGWAPSWISDNIERVMGYTTAEALKSDWWSTHVHPDDLPRVRLLSDALYREAGHLSTDYRFQTGPGIYRWIHDDARMERDETGSQVMFGAWIDVTEQKEAESALRASEQRFRELAENVREVFFVSEPGTGQAIYLSPAYETVFGHSREHAYATPNAWLEEVHPEDRARMLDSLQNAEDDDQRTEDVFRVLRPDGSVRWVHGRATPVLDQSGSVVRIVGIAEDITELRRTQQQLLQAQKMEAVGQLAGGVAHDFNNLLSVIMAQGDLLLEDFADDKRVKDGVIEIHDAATRAAGLTRQLLAFSRRQVMEPRALDLNELVQNIEKMLRRLIGEDIEFTSVLEQNLGTVRADPGKLEQVLVNLVVNSRDAMPEGGKLIVETLNVELGELYVSSHEPVPPGSYVLLTVSDSGTGMTEAVRARLFEPFFTTKELGKGTGLGLSTVYGIVKQSGGFVWVYSELGQGTTFKVYLPRVAGEADALPVAGSTQSQPTGTETVLLVEDEPAVRTLTQTVLIRRGYVVLAAANGEEALKRAESHDGVIHLLLTDVIMPGITGRELATRLLQQRPDLKVLFLSGYTDRAIAQQGMLEPGVAFLEKPFTADGLSRKIRQALDPPPSLPQ